ncbi:MAG: hypothetical protein F6J93_32285 [Oscillatoria sp. SIO1A7]|nr:hypothetical protein [Oscillatoria sp. SIO1A7]
MKKHRFDPNKHHRRSTRCPEYDYTSPGAYFITICADKRQFIFGEIVDGILYANACGQTVIEVWNRLPLYFRHISLDVFVVMPNHVHGILWINERLDSKPPPPWQENRRPNGTAPGSVSAIIQNFKSVSTRRVNRLRGTKGRIWQRNFYDRINRNQESLHSIRQYIINNPLSWEDDLENPDRVPNL